MESKTIFFNFLWLTAYLFCLFEIADCCLGLGVVEVESVVIVEVALKQGVLLY